MPAIAAARRSRHRALTAHWLFSFAAAARRGALRRQGFCRGGGGGRDMDNSGAAFGSGAGPWCTN